MLWQLFTASRPPPPPVGSAASMAAAKEAVAAKAKEAYAEVVAAQREEGGVSMLSLLATPPQQSCMWVQVSHDLIEFQTLGSWAPLYLHEALGVPLGSVGAFMIWPMAVSMVRKSPS